MNHSLKYVENRLNTFLNDYRKNTLIRGAEVGKDGEGYHIIVHYRPCPRKIVKTKMWNSIRLVWKSIYSKPLALKRYYD